MKKIFATILTASLMLVATNAFAQLSATAGYLNTTETTTVTTTSGSTTTTSSASADLNGFFVGANYGIDIPAVNGLGAVAGVNASFLFGSNHYDGLWGLGARTVKDSEIALNVPINLTYSYALNGDTKLFAFAGPTLQFALSNKSVTIFDSDKDTKHETDNLGGDDPARNPFNLLIGGGIGAQVSGIQITVGYEHSLLNYATADNTNIGRSIIKIGVGYAF